MTINKKDLIMSEEVEVLVAAEQAVNRRSELFIRAYELLLKNCDVIDDALDYDVILTLRERRSNDQMKTINKDTYEKNSDVFKINSDDSNKNITVVGILGKAGSGKDTVSKHLEKEYGYVKKSLAMPVKSILQTAFFLSDEEVYDEESRDTNVIDLFPNYVVRKGLQDIATMFRDKYSHIWALNLVKRILHWNDKTGHTKFVISDIRLQDEIDELSERFDSKFIRIIRKDYQRLDGELSKHVTENTDELKTDFVIENGDGFEKLYSDVDFIMDSLDSNSINARCMG